MILLTIYWIAKELGKHRIKPNSRLFRFLGHPYCIFDFLVTPISVVGVSIFSYEVLFKTSLQSRLHCQSLTLMFALILVMHIVRAFSVYTGNFGQFSKSYLNVIHVGLLNFLGVAFIYTAAFSQSRYAQFACWPLLFISSARLLRSRAFDDFASTEIVNKNASFGQTYIVMMFDIGLRSLVGVVISFALSCLLLVKNPNIGRKMEDVGSFIIGHPIENLFFDFIYFSVVTLATVGYGDITPTATASKLTTALFALLGYVLFAAIIGTGVSIALDTRKR